MGVTGGEDSIVQDGLVFSADCLNSMSYPGTGTNWNSVVSNNNTGSMDSGVTFDGKHMNFASDNATFNQTASPITSNIMSTEIWFYSDGGGHDAVVATRDQNSSDGGIYMKHHADRIYVYNQNNQNTYTNQIYLSNTWYHLVVTTSGSTYPDGIKIYQNGVNNIQGSDTLSSPWTSATTLPFSVGSEPDSGNSFEGSIDIIRTYNRVLTQTEVLQNYNATKERYGY